MQNSGALLSNRVARETWTETRRGILLAGQNGAASCRRPSHERGETRYTSGTQRGHNE